MLVAPRYTPASRQPSTAPRSELADCPQALPSGGGHEPSTGAGGAGAGSSGQQQRGAAGDAAWLARQHPWADQELQRLVLEAAGGDSRMAAELLGEMAPGGGCAPGNRAPLPAPQASAAQCPGAPRPAGAAADAAAAAAAGAPGDGGPGNDEDGGLDPYYRFRCHALGLTRQWRRAARRAAAAHAAGDRGAARRLAAEARRLRAESLAAHAEAAERIEMHVNRDSECGGGGWTP